MYDKPSECDFCRFPTDQLTEHDGLFYCLGHECRDALTRAIKDLA